MYRLYMIKSDHFFEEHTGTIPSLIKIVLESGKLRIWQIWDFFFYIFNHTTGRFPYQFFFASHYPLHLPV